jgi:hypothetical protein
MVTKSSKDIGPWGPRLPGEDGDPPCPPFPSPRETKFHLTDEAIAILEHVDAETNTTIDGVLERAIRLYGDQTGLVLRWNSRAGAFPILCVHRNLCRNRRRPRSGCGQRPNEVRVP